MRSNVWVERSGTATLEPGELLLCKASFGASLNERPGELELVLKSFVSFTVVRVFHPLLVIGCVPYSLQNLLCSFQGQINLTFWGLLGLLDEDAHHNHALTSCRDVDCS